MKTEFKHFDFLRWMSHGGNLDTPPYWDEEERKGGTFQRVFVSADIFSDWSAWKVEAERACDAAIMGPDIQQPSLSVRRSDAPPLATTPLFVVERLRGIGVTRLWLNATIADKPIFEAAKKEAKERAARIEEAERAGNIVFLANEATPSTKYDSRLNVPSKADRAMLQMYANITG